MAALCMRQSNQQEETSEETQNKSRNETSKQTSKTEGAMVKHSNGVGYFTAENIVGVLRALPATDGTYAEVVEQAEEYGRYHLENRAGEMGGQRPPGSPGR